MDEAGAQDKSLDALMQKGYFNGMRSFMQMTSSSVGFLVTAKMVAVSPQAIPLIQKEGEIIALRTDIIGEVSGRSYLVMNDTEATYLSRHSLKQYPSHHGIKEAFLKELDNIVSASVISKVSQALSLKMYGDIPHYEVYPSTVELCNKVTSDMEGMGQYYLNMAEIIVDGNSKVNPFFVWVMGDKFLKNLEFLGYTTVSATA